MENSEKAGKAEEKSPKISEDFDSENGWITSLDGLCQSVAEASPGKQALIGGLSGWTAGFLGMKMSKMIAFTAGCSLLVVQVASYSGWTRVNWKKVGGNVVAIRNATKVVSEKNSNASAKLMQNLVENNSHLAGGFVTGFLLGASST